VSVSRIPLCDLAAQHEEVASEIREGFDRVFQRSAFIGGTEVAEFETAFARFAGVPHCVGVGNGTDALEFALRATDVRPGDDVLLPANTFVATAMAVVRCGARPVLVDVDPDYLLLDVAKAEAQVTPATRAVVPSTSSPLAPMEDVPPCPGADLIVVEMPPRCTVPAATGFTLAGSAPRLRRASIREEPRCCRRRQMSHVVQRVAADPGDPQSRGSGRTSTTCSGSTRAGHAAGDRTSAKPRVSLGGTTADARRPSATTRSLRTCRKWCAPDTRGQRARLPSLRHPAPPTAFSRVSTAGVGAKVHYPTPLHLVPALRWLGYAMGDFPVSERAAREMVSLPIYPHITPQQQEHVVAVLRRALGEPS
jgi:hypothetical protein